MKAFVISALLMLSATAQAQTSFAKEVVPILRLNCVGCHMTGTEPGGMQLHPGKAYQSLVNIPAQGAPMARVTPGQPEKSYLLHKLRGTHLEVGGQGVRMPFAMPALPEKDLETITHWIKEGALNQ